MKKVLSILLILCFLGLPGYAEDIKLAPDGWLYIGYTYGGITFPIPGDIEFYELTAQEQAAGIILIGYNDDCTVQLRGFPPEALTLNQFKELVLNEPTAEVSFLGEDDSIICVRNTAPTANSELFGISLNGLDGNMYKISIFTGIDEDYSADAAAWEIAQTIAAYTSQMDFSEWPLKENTAP